MKRFFWLLLATVLIFCGCSSAIDFNGANPEQDDRSSSTTAKESVTNIDEDDGVSTTLSQLQTTDATLYGATFRGYAQWNMAMINFVQPVSLEGAESVIIEIRFNKSHSGQWIRPVAGTSDGTIYDSFYSNTAGKWHSYRIDHDPYFSTPYYEDWVEDASSIEASWNGYSFAPTYHIEVPLGDFFAKCNYIDSMRVPAFAPLTQDKYLNKVGIHILNVNENDFTIGRTYIRQNGIVVQTTDPIDYSTTKADNKVFVYPWQLDGNPSPLSVELTVPQSKVNKKKMLVIGDSIMTTGISKTMVRDIANHFNAELARDAVNGSSLGGWKGEGAIDHAMKGYYKNYVDIYGEFDYIIIERGTNDLYYANVNSQEVYIMGDENSVGYNSTFGAWKYLLQHFKEICPNTKVICSTMLFRKDAGVTNEQVLEYNQTLKKVVDKFDNAYVFDLYNRSGINESNYQTYLSDLLHPNDAGSKLLTQKWIEGISEITAL